jgi:hypothetical protein
VRAAAHLLAVAFFFEGDLLAVAGLLEMER